MTLLPITKRTTYCFKDCGKEVCKCKPAKVLQTPNQLADKIISMLQQHGLTLDLMLEVLSIAKRKIERNIVEEQLNKPCKQLKLFD